MMSPLATAAVAVAFVTWAKVTPETITRHVPEFVNSPGSYGSVLPASVRQVKAFTGCPVYESGVLVGYSFLDCHQKDLPSDYQ